MTKEEMAKAYAEGFEDKNYREIAYAAFLCGFTAKCESSLPSNLDEAAEEIASDIAPTHPDIGWDACFEKIKEGIRSGAEWMAGQGVSMLGRIGIYGVDVESITKELREAGFNLGEEIILQIRKKQ